MDRRGFLGNTMLAGAVLAWAGAPATAAPLPADGLEAQVATLVADGGFSGTVLVEHQGAVVLHQAYGLAERSFQVPCRLDGLYRIASITKLFTSTLVLRLAARGRLSLDAVIRTYLPAYKGPAADTVSVRQLLTHTSGIENFDKGLTSYTDAARAGIPAYQLPHSSDELMDRYASGPLVNPPGSTFDYNNADYVILGKVVEAVTGGTYDQALRHDILDPLGLAHTGMARQDVILPNLAATYYKDGDRDLAHDMPVYPQNWYAAGGLYSTTGDLLAFARALYGGTLLSPAQLAQLLTPAKEEYGFGLWLSDLQARGRPHRYAQRPGRIMGANTLLLRFLDDDLTIIILGNTNLADTDRMGFRIARWFLGPKD
ncbi:MAG: serine hydrolase [Azospirillaceae bacterium]|nr:serine hydrolase [Azospirillaceae bacterium]